MNIDHVEIQQLMRQMVDLGIADNLKLWVHNGLVKTRTSGSDLFVPKAYDISGQENDAAQSTEDNQPKLVSLGMEFDGSNDNLYVGNGTNNSLIFHTGTIVFWMKTPASISNIQRMFWNNSAYGIRISVNRVLQTYDWITSTTRTSNTNVWALNTWQMLAFVFVHNSANQSFAYINASNVWTTTTGGTSGQGLYIGRFQFNETEYFNGTLNDIRLFNTALTSAQIAAIYNATKSKYGHS